MEIINILLSIILGGLLTAYIVANIDLLFDTNDKFYAMMTEQFHSSMKVKIYVISIIVLLLIIFLIISSILLLAFTSLHGSHYDNSEFTSIFFL